MHAILVRESGMNIHEVDYRDTIACSSTCPPILHYELYTFYNASKCCGPSWYIARVIPNHWRIQTAYSFLWPEAVGKGAVRGLLLFVELLSQWFCIIYYDGVNGCLLDMYNLNPASSCVAGYNRGGHSYHPRAFGQLSDIRFCFLHIFCVLSVWGLEEIKSCCFLMIALFISLSVQFTLSFFRVVVRTELMFG